LSCSGHEAYTHLSVSVKPDRTVLRSSARHSTKASELHMGAMTLSVYVQAYDKIFVNDDTIIRIDPHGLLAKMCFSVRGLLVANVVANISNDHYFVNNEKHCEPCGGPPVADIST
jgi:hypothetical protein